MASKAESSKKSKETRREKGAGTSTRSEEKSASLSAAGTSSLNGASGPSIRLNKEAIKEAETIITQLGMDVPAHLRDMVVARAHDAFSLAKCGRSPQVPICQAMKCIERMGHTSDPYRKMRLLSCALERIRGECGPGLSAVRNAENASNRKKRCASKTVRRKKKC